MPTYEYECPRCPRVFEVKQRITEPALETCDRCGGPIHRLLSAAPFILKGEGWYVTDYPSESRKKAKESTSKESTSKESTRRSRRGRNRRRREMAEAPNPSRRRHRRASLARTAAAAPLSHDQSQAEASREQAGRRLLRSRLTRPASRERSRRGRAPRWSRALPALTKISRRPVEPTMTAGSPIAALGVRVHRPAQTTPRHLHHQPARRPEPRRAARPGSR